jgi:hypothetical protein
MIRRALLLLSCTLLLPAGIEAAGGKWTPEQLLELPTESLRQMGLALDPALLWSRGGGLLDATVQLPGCSGGLVSKSGLVITNHHCAYSVLQQGSTPENNLIARGFYAATREREIPAAGMRVTIPLGSTDVSAEMAAAVPRGADDLARFRALEHHGKELVAACEQRPNRRCQLAVFDGGARYALVEGIEYPDIRLVFAPPAAVGEYGGEIDNWSWPRHTGDFSLLRVYAAADGSPAPSGPTNGARVPRHAFRMSAKGVSPGDFVLVAGYPGATYRSLTLPEMKERAERFYPRRAELFRAWIDILDKAAAADPKAGLALADRIKSRANQEKNARGQIEGIARGRMVEQKENGEREVLRWAAERPEHRGAVQAYRELEELAAERAATWERDFLLQQLQPTNGVVKPLELALTVVRTAHERAKPDLERQSAYMERNWSRLEDGLKRAQSRFFLPAETALLADVFERAAALPAESRSLAFDRLLAGVATPEARGAKAAALLAATRVTDLGQRLAMFRESEAQLATRHDPLLDFALALDAELRDSDDRQDRFAGAVSRLRPPFRRAVEAHAGRPIAPDGNSTLRVSLSHVQGYKPRDGMLYEPQTTVAGMVAKHTGKDPFDAPEALRQAAASSPRSRWADTELGDVPVAFLADGDTTGGSSGSPVLNGRGELVGVNFDRVWENVANDFGWNPDVARSVAVDARYVFWVIESLHGKAAEPLLTELGAPPVGK